MECLIKPLKIDNYCCNHCNIHKISISKLFNFLSEHSVAKRKLHQVLQEGLLDSVLPYLVPKNGAAATAASKKSDEAAKKPPSPSQEKPSRRGRTQDKASRIRCRARFEKAKKNTFYSLIILIPFAATQRWKSTCATRSKGSKRHSSVPRRCSSQKWDILRKSRQVRQEKLHFY